MDLQVTPVQCWKLRLQMGEALICGFLNAGMCTPDRISVSVRSEERSQRMLSLGVQVREQGCCWDLSICDLCSCTGMCRARFSKPQMPCCSILGETLTLVARRALN